MKDTVKQVTFNRAWDNPHGGKLYYFNVEFASGKVGQFSTKTENQVKFTVGKEYDDIVEETKTTKNGNYLFFTREGKIGNKKSYYDDPIVQARITTAKALEMAILIAKRNPKMVKGDIVKLQPILVTWILKLGEEPQVQLSRRTALELAVSTMDIPCEEIADVKTVFEVAEKYYQIIK